MTVFSNNQGEIDAATAAIDGALGVITELGQELADLKSQEGADRLDWSRLDAKVAEVNAKVTAASVSAPVVDVSALQVAGNFGQPPAAPDTDSDTAPEVADAEPASTEPASTEPASTEPAAAGGQHAAPEDQPAGKPLYKHVGADPVDATAWPAADLVAADDGATLYTYSGDTAGGEPTGASADWTIYTGPTSEAAGDSATA